MSLKLFAMLAPVLVVAAVAGCAPSDSARTAGPASSAPAHGASDQLRFTAKTLEGSDFSGESLVGKPAVLWFWAPWCPTCQREAPMVEKAAQTHPGVAFIGVSARDKLPAMEDFVKKYGLTFTQLNDADSQVWGQFGITHQPAYAFVDRSGSVDIAKSSLSEEDLNNRINAVGVR